MLIVRRALGTAWAKATDAVSLADPVTLARGERMAVWALYDSGLAVPVVMFGSQTLTCIRSQVGTGLAIALWMLDEKTAVPGVGALVLTAETTSAYLCLLASVYSPCFPSPPLVDLSGGNADTDDVAYASFAGHTVGDDEMAIVCAAWLRDSGSTGTIDWTHGLAMTEGQSVNTGKLGPSASLSGAYKQLGTGGVMVQDAEGELSTAAPWVAIGCTLWPFNLPIRAATLRAGTRTATLRGR